MARSFANVARDRPRVGPDDLPGANGPGPEGDYRPDRPGLGRFAQVGIARPMACGPWSGRPPCPTLTGIGEWALTKF